MSDHSQVLIIGGGSGGLTVAARLRNAPNPPSVTILEPSDKHFYQPLWTLVGGGVFPKEETMRDEADFIPPGATWLREAAARFEPDARRVITASGRVLTYDYLVVAAGLQLNWGAVQGLKESVGKGGVCSNYSYDTVQSTWEALQAFRGGVALFTQPSTTVKCGGAPQKIMYLVEDYLRRNGLRDRSQVVFALPGEAIFGVPKYRAALEKIVAKRKIDARFGHDLVALHPDKREAVFQHLPSGEQRVIKYDMIHVTPPQGPMDFLKSSPLVDAAGWVDVDKHTLQHVRFPTVFSLGDCSSLPTAKTGAAIRKQAPVLVANLLAHRDGQPLRGRYDGYTSCPLVTGYDRLILAEFDYDKNPAESFPFDQSQERYSMYALKAYALPQLYWHGMLRGRA